MAPKAFKVRGPEGGRKFGVAAKSLKELLAKARALLQLPSPGSRLCLYEDGTEMTEAYFKKVEGNSELILLPPGEKWQGYVSEIQRFLDAFSSRTDDIVRAAQGLLSDEQAPKKRKLLADLIHNLSENIAAESRADDEKWFQGVESRFKTKSSYMRYSCESRIRGYMKEIAEAMMEKLKSERYNGCYFDRREEENVCLCTPEGWFSCQGPFDTKDCPCRHSINPYGNKESRILFSTWNLDHVYVPGQHPMDRGDQRIVCASILDAQNEMACLVLRGTGYLRLEIQNTRIFMHQGEGTYVPPSHISLQNPYRIKLTKEAFCNNTHLHTLTAF
ncbi:DNA fragmentation factor subunit beta isoform X3 [Sceloporus undulatus]|uniref:DNA fragmentation factor subunit beta isoform X3 n=1 Tax=Sceloporus undulatus TaxID=8520 RepID=UPI001C4C0D6B|nr:DNA fragmentation factor subunit beta isoform X3 [Sceloporus undulatus]